MGGKVVVFFSTKGGVGKTVLSSNLGVLLSKTYGRKVLLLDLDLIWGGISQVLNLQSGAGSPANKNCVKQDEKKPLAIREHESGLKVLTFSSPAAGKNMIPEGYIQEILQDLKEDFEYIIVDTPCSVDKRVLVALDLADMILMLGEPDLTTIKNLKQGLTLLSSLRFPTSKVEVVLNRAGSPSGLGMEEIENFLRHPVLGALPSDGQLVPLSVNRGLPFVDTNPQAAISLSLKKLADQVLSKTIAENKPRSVKTGDAVRKGSEEWSRLRGALYHQVLDSFKLDELEGLDATRLEDAYLRQKIVVFSGQILDRIPEAARLSREEQYCLINEVVDDVVGLGTIEEFLRDPEITEIMVNGAHQIYIERKGRLEKTVQTFVSDAQVLRVLEKIVAPLGRRIDESSPMVDARLRDGSRVHAIIPPLCLNGPTLTIRKFSPQGFTIRDLVAKGTLTTEMAVFLHKAVLERKNIVISGGTGSGKTTLLNTLSMLIPDQERIVTIEDAAELRLQQPHVVRLEARPPNIEGQGTVTIRELVRNALRMRPDRIVVGEVRGGEALDMLQAMNTGHDGSLATLHANSPEDALSRLSTMVLMSGFDFPIRAIREQIVAGLDLIVHVARLRDGSRRVTQIAEIQTLEQDKILIHQIFPTGEDVGYADLKGGLSCTG